jgi:hypothetical protein
MKSVIFFLMLLAPVFLTSCAVSEQSVGEVGEKFQEGIQGRGTIIPHSATTDTFGPDFR